MNGRSSPPSSSALRDVSNEPSRRAPACRQCVTCQSYFDPRYGPCPFCPGWEPPSQVEIETDESEEEEESSSVEEQYETEETEGSETEGHATDAED